ncbi:MAG: acetylglutamate kinase [Coriobacteriia bacterium]|nr:acetylglutamate kinase [Coriobacteriia bacterium]MBS5477716.1 acetylglutamate kinase [Coriobacteriia bacterium]
MEAVTRSELAGEGEAQEALFTRAETLTQALPWIKAMAGTTVVIKYGGAAMVDPTLRAQVMEDIMLLRLVGVNPIIVHGGGKDISALVEQLGLPVEFKDGVRVTSPEVMRIVSMVLTGKVNEELVLALNAHGPLAVGFAGVAGSMTHCELVDPALGRVGNPTMIDTDLIKTLQDQGYIPVIASIGVGPDGQAVNVNADTFASAIAQTCKASKIIFLTDVDGLYEDFSDKSSLIGRMTADDARELIAGGTLSKGMIPKVKAAVDALDNGVQRAHILNGTAAHSLILELFTNSGVGTMITSSADDLFKHDVATRVRREAVR